MTPHNSTTHVNWLTDAREYGIDTAQRTILFWDIMRQRGNIYLDHRAKGQPPVLVFDYETILDGRDVARPVNYSLVQIIDRRGTKPDRRLTAPPPNREIADKRGTQPDRRDQPKGLIGEAFEANRPVLIIDPRAGHGPGIGGSKQDSQIGMALNAGHPVYFLVFSIFPEPNQTLADVWRAEIRFLEEIRRRHPEAPKPALIGNCQGGWAAALIGAERPDITGPMAFNGSPLSYWGGVDGVNPMRYTGGLIGGVWINNFLSDLGNGLFDGANLVANFENLNPANTIWTKQYNLYANVDTEAARFLKFEKWWGGFYIMTGDEIATIVNGLFVGNKLEQGQFELEAGKAINLSNFQDPVVLFTSFGDNITPPQQALNWVAKVYGSSREIKRKGQVIVLVMHATIGHLGIFVSAKIARKEHKEIIGSFDMLESLPPGLYEMIIEQDADATPESGYRVRFAERQVDDILSYDDGLADEQAFAPVKTVSDRNDTFYRTVMRPWVRIFVTDATAELTRQLHPLRLQRYAFSDMNPLTWPLKLAAPIIKENRQPASADNPFLAMEKAFSANMTTCLNTYRDIRDSGQEFFFKLIYDNPWTRALFPVPEDRQPDRRREMEAQWQQDADQWRAAMSQGDYPEAVVRILLAIMTADRELTRDEYDTAETVILDLKPLEEMTWDKLRQLVKTQARMLQTDRAAALAALPHLLSRQADRTSALNIVAAYAQATGRALNEDEQETLNTIETILKGSSDDNQQDL
jgi:pimeloyl-ACP methyl ester carboxylesterase